MFDQSCTHIGFRRVLQLGLFALLAASAESSLYGTDLVVERPSGDPSYYTSVYGIARAASFTIDEGLEIQGISAWINAGGGGETASFSIGTFDSQLRYDSYFISDPFLLGNADHASAKWQGVGGLKWDLPAGTYSIVINGAFVPSSFGGPPSTIDNSTFDFLLEDYDGTWYPTFLPFGVRIYGAPLSAVPEPAWYGLIGSGTLLLAAAFRRRVRHKFAPLPARSAIRHS